MIMIIFLMVATLVQEWILAIILVHTKALMVTLFLVVTMLALMMMLVQEQATLVQEWIFLMILTCLMAATVVQEWTLAMILVHVKALIVMVRMTLPSEVKIGMKPLIQEMVLK